MNASQRRKKLKRLLTKAAGNNKCGICSKPIFFKKHNVTIDHIVPISKGGGNILSNLQLAHYECNQAKGNRIL
jgi:5-methylcytosine-specific restriction endonuclease McrA